MAFLNRHKTKIIWLRCVELKSVYIHGCVCVCVFVFGRYAIVQKHVSILLVQFYRHNNQHQNSFVQKQCVCIFNCTIFTFLPLICNRLMQKKNNNEERIYLFIKSNRSTFGGLIIILNNLLYDIYQQQKIVIKSNAFRVLLGWLLDFKF